MRLPIPIGSGLAMLVMPAEVMRFVHAAVHCQRSGGKAQQARIRRPLHLLVQQSPDARLLEQSTRGPAKRVVIRHTLQAQVRKPIGTVPKKPFEFAVAQSKQLPNDQAREQLRQRKIAAEYLLENGFKRRWAKHQAACITLRGD
jgi:hypothetical protein